MHLNLFIWNALEARNCSPSYSQQSDSVPPSIFDPFLAEPRNSAHLIDPATSEQSNSTHLIDSATDLHQSVKQEENLEQ